MYPSKVNRRRLVPFPKPHDEATERWKYSKITRGRARAATQPFPSQFRHSRSNQWHFTWEGQINTWKLFGDGSSERCEEGRIWRVKVLWRESLAGIAWQNYTSLLTLHSLDFHICLSLFFFKPRALLTWESCCVKRYWLEFLISCHYSMTIGEWNVFYFFHQGYASSAWDTAIAQAVSSRHFQLKIFAVWAKRRICPRSNPQLSVLFLELNRSVAKCILRPEASRRMADLGTFHFSLRPAEGQFFSPSRGMVAIRSNTCCLSSISGLVLKKVKESEITKGVGKSQTASVGIM